MKCSAQWLTASSNAGSWRHRSCLTLLPTGARLAPAQRQPAHALHSSPAPHHSLHCSVEGRGVIVAESVLAPREQRQAWAEVLFEEHSASHVHLARSGVLSLYAHARTTGLVIDMGWGGCSVTPVGEGYPFMLGSQLLPATSVHAANSALLHSLSSHGAAFKQGSTTLHQVPCSDALPSSAGLLPLVTALDVRRAVRCSLAFPARLLRISPATAPHRWLWMTCVQV